MVSSPYKRHHFVVSEEHPLVYPNPRPKKKAPDNCSFVGCDTDGEDGIWALDVELGKSFFGSKFSVDTGICTLFCLGFLGSVETFISSSDKFANSFVFFPPLTPGYACSSISLI